LEDRRVLYNPAFLEVRNQVDQSILDIRKGCTETLCELGESAFTALAIRTIRAASRSFYDDSNLEFRFFDFRSRLGETPGFFMALGAFRAVVRQQVALIAAHYDLNIEGD